MSNRLLRFSVDENGKVVTAEGAKGYQASKGMYGEYGEKGRLTRLQRERLKRWEDAVDKYQNDMIGGNDE